MSEVADYVVAGLGALGSATCRELARRGRRVIGLERFELGHARGASHDTSRILRHSYHTPAYVRLTQEAYDDWALLEAETGTSLVTTVGGLDLFPPDAAISAVDYTTSLDESGIGYELLDRAAIGDRWGQFRVPDGVLGLYQARGAIVPAGLGTRTMADDARAHGADLRARTPVTGVRDLGASGIEVTTPDGVISCGGLVVTADAWVNHVLAPLGVRLPVETTLEQVTYFAPPSPLDFEGLPIWIWMDDPSYYGFPCYGEATVKAAQDCGGPTVDPDHRTFEPDGGMQDRLARFMAEHLPGSGPPVRSLRCQYTLTPDRDFVMSAVPGHDRVVVGLGAAHGFKFAPTFGRVLADLVTEGVTTSGIDDFAFERSALTDPCYRAHWLV